MQTILVGLLAALLWGFHDLCVRFITQRNSIVASLFTVLASGAILVIGVAAIWGDWGDLSAHAAGLSLASGVIYAFAAYALYRAFEIGPVKLVAPLIGAYPILSVGFAAISGQSVSWDQWLAVLLIVAGVGAVAVFSAEEDTEGREISAIAWGVAAGAGFASTFAVGQAAAETGAELPVIALTRIAALAGVMVFALARRSNLKPSARSLPLLIVMGVLDATALGLVTFAGGMPRPEFAAVASSLFGLITVVLAWLILKEKMTGPQWLSVGAVFAGIGWLGL